MSGTIQQTQTRAATPASDVTLAPVTTLDVPSGVQMSPEQIIAYLGQRLGGIDGQFQDYKKESDRRAKISDELKELKAVLQGMYTPGAGVTKDNADDKYFTNVQSALNAVRTKYADTGSSAGPGPALGDPCADVFAAFDTLVSKTMPDEIGRNGSIGPGAFDQLSTTIDGRVQSLNGDNEMTMMSLQQLMQARSQVVSMCTNMLSSLNESAKGILSNLR